ncbi:MAG: transglycosylase SLT domain-containing protein [Treponema sp.]|nr:transglycosylase SLT domain-containing protein [Treponema sp.]
MKKSFLLCVFFLFSTNFIFCQEQILEEQIKEEIIQDKLPEHAEVLQEEIPVHKEFTLGFTDHPEVERFRKLYSSEKWSKNLANNLEKGLSYRMYVRHAIQEQNLPPELEYLPIIESNYKTWAKSKSGALGLWQFMENSVKPFLIINDYVD